MPDQALTHTESQNEAITSWGQGDVCVIAGPGSGKTRVLVERIRWLVTEKRVDPEKIAAITFTRKAATSMYQRLVRPLAADSELRQAFEKVHVSTIHGLCARLLREHALSAGVDPEFRLLDPAEADFELRRVIDETLDSLYEQDPLAARAFLTAFKGANDFVDEIDYSRVHQQLKNVIESIRASGEPELRPAVEDPHALLRGWPARAVGAILENYRTWKRVHSALDFADLELETVRLLDKDPMVARFEHVLVDENQDTNPLQAELIKLLSVFDATLFAVGDLNQSIYSFRNAEPKVFAAFREDALAGPGRVVDLRENFRSRKDILDAVQALTHKAPGVERHELHAAREFKAKRVPSVEVQLVRARSAGQARLREARWTVKRIIELRESLRLGGDRRPLWKDFAILVRTNPLLTPFAEALRSAGVPYQLNAGRSFFESEEVRDFLRLLWTLDNPRDEISLAAVLRSPLCDVSDEALFRLKADGRALAVAIQTADGLSADEAQAVTRFARQLDELRAEREDAPVEALLARALNKTGYETWLLEQEGGAQRAANLQKLARIAARAGNHGELSFGEMIRRLDLMGAAAGAEGEATVPDDAADAVHLMTVHTAKGLEFPIVFLPAINSAGRNESDSLLFSPEHGLGARWVDGGRDGPLKDRVVEDPPYQRLHELKKRREKEEEDRIFYVALTRAEEHLVLSAAWGNQVRADAWSKHLRDGLGLDIKRIDEEPVELTTRGCRIRLNATDQDPRIESIETPEERRLSVVRVNPLTVKGQADSEATVTDIALFAECPRRYYYSRFVGVGDSGTAGRSGSRGGEPAAALGSTVHDLLAGALDPQQASAEARRLAGVFDKSELGRRVQRAAKVDREQSLLFPVRGRLLRGRVDLVFEDAAGRVLVDYKTDDVSAAEAREKAAEHSLQLQLYSFARPADRAVVYFLRPDAPIDVPVDTAALDRAADRTEELFQAQERLEFPLNVGEHCRLCPHYRKSCPAEVPRARATGTGQLPLFG